MNLSQIHNSIPQLNIIKKIYSIKCSFVLQFIIILKQILKHDGSQYKLLQNALGRKNKRRKVFQIWRALDILIYLVTCYLSTFKIHELELSPTCLNFFNFFLTIVNFFRNLFHICSPKKSNFFLTK